MTEPARFAPNEWRRLSPWSIVHFSWRAIFANVQATIAFLGGTTYGVSVSELNELTWFVPLIIIAFVLLSSIVSYYFYSYRVLEDSVQVRRGALFKQNLNLSFARIQNVTLEHPFYFRPIERVTLKVDGAGSKGEEVYVPALKVPDAVAARNFIVARKRGTGVADSESAVSDTPSTIETPTEPADTGQAFFRRSLFDLVIHGLSNNRSFIAIAGILAFLGQSNISPQGIANRLGIDFDVIVGGLSIVRLVLLFALSLILSIGIIAVLSVLVAIVTYYGFTMYRTTDGLTITRGLFTKHEIHVQKSRIQTVLLRQDWLDYLLGRRNVILERISHSQQQGDPWAAMKKKIFVPSVRIAETTTVTEEVLPGIRVEDLPFTPISKRYFYKYSLIGSVIFATALILTLQLPEAVDWLPIVVCIIWPLFIFHRYMSWRRAGLAISGDVVVARSGTIGIDYHLFPAYKTQDVSHTQSILMKRRNLSSLLFHTASTTIRVPYLGTDFAKSVVDYCTYSAESTERSWM